MNASRRDAMIQEIRQQLRAKLPPREELALNGALRALLSEQSKTAYWKKRGAMAKVRRKT